MGFYQSKHKPDEIAQEKRKFLALSVDAKRLGYPNGYTSLHGIKTWQDYYEKTIPPTERSITSAFQINSEINQKMSLWRGDITKLELDAIVNSAARIESGEVNKAIIKAAGPFYKEECALEGLAPVGEAMVTGGYQLPARYVINTLAPPKQDMTLLENCYRKSLDAAKTLGLRSLALPCIATRKKNRFSTENAAKLALHTVRNWMEVNHSHVDRVIFCVYKEEDLKVYRQYMQEYFPVLARIPHEPLTDLTDSGEMQETSFVDSTSSESEFSSGSPPGAAAPKQYKRRSKPLLTVEDWQDETVNCENEYICINRMNKTGLLKRLYSIYTDPNMDASRCPVIKYEGEHGIDLGGIQREYFVQALDVLSTTTFDGCPSFEGAIDHKLPFASKMHVQRNVFHAFGRALAHSVLHGGIGYVGMSRAIVFMLSHEVSPGEIEESSVPLSAEDLPHDDLKEILKVDKCKMLTVDQKNVLRDYLDRGSIGYGGINDSKFGFYKQELLMYEVITRRWSQIEAIRRGMDSVKNDSHGKCGVGLYSFLCSSPRPGNISRVFPSQRDITIDVPRLSSRIRYDCQQDEKVVVFFKQLLDDLAQKIEDVGLDTLLEFWTGHPLLPSEGFLPVEIGSEDQLPQAHTCFLKLVIPGDHETYESFRQAFVTALRHGSIGFGDE